MQTYSRLPKDHELAQHHGVFRRQLSLWEAVGLIVSGTVGAGVLAIPYVVAQVGILIGLAYIVGIGFMMMGFHLLLGQITAKTEEPLHLVGLAGKYLGKDGKFLMGLVFYSMLIGAMVIYIIGEGQALAALFNGSPFTWSLLFFAFASILILFGLHTVKTIEVVLVFSILTVVLLIAAWSAPHVTFENISYISLATVFLPYGVLLFAFHGAAAIPEAHSLLKERHAMFKKAIIYATLITMAIYAVFAFMVVGVTGPETTEVASIGLGEVIGPRMVLFGNLFAALAMGTSFLLIGVALSDSLQWDFKVPRFFSLTIATIVPLLIFLFGVRGFVNAIEIVGGVLISIEMLLVLAIYWHCKQKGDMPSRFRLHHTAFLFAFLLLALLGGVVYSIANLF